MELVEIFSSLLKAELSNSWLTSYREWPLYPGTKDTSRLYTLGLNYLRL